MANKKALPKRQGIKPSIRFEVFRRDDFTCKYCGKSVSDGVVLNVDHVISVKKGGTNEIENLITSCFDCNIGKSTKLLTDSKAPNVGDTLKKLKDKLTSQKEYEKQLKEYYKVKKKLVTNMPEINVINKILASELNYTLTPLGMKDFVKLFRQIPMDEFIDAISIVIGKFGQTGDRKDEAHKYLCGIMFNKFRAITDPHYQDEIDVKNYYLNHPDRVGHSFYQNWKIKPFIKQLGVEDVKKLIDYNFSHGGDFSLLINECEYTLDYNDFYENKDITN